MIDRRGFLAGSAAGLLTGVVAHSSAQQKTASRNDSDREAALNRGHHFVHPGIYQTGADLQFMKRKIEADEDPWKSAWDTLLARDISSLDFHPKPVTHIVRGSYGAGQHGNSEINASVDAAHSHVLQWYVTGQKKHALKTIEILDAWSSKLASFAGNDAMLLAGWTGGALCDSAEILRATYPGWSADSMAGFKRMMLTVYVPLLVRFFPEANGNWDAAIMHTLLGIAVFCEDRALVARVLHHYRVGNGNAGIARYVYPSGQCEENTRDQAHAQLGLGYFALTSLVAWNQGIDLFSEAGDRLALGFEYTSRYMLGEDVPHFGTLSENVRGRFDDFYEVALQHYRYNRRIAMPYTERAALLARPRSRTVLTMHRGEISSAPPQLASPPVPSTLVANAGAQTAAAAAPPEAVVVSSGDSIQQALDDISAKGGGTLWLGPGLHSLKQQLRLPSGVTMVGAGRESVLYLLPDQRTPTIVNAVPDLHDVELSNFIVECGLQPEPNRDPNQDSRPRRSQMAPSRGGISLLADDPAAMHNIKLRQMTVRHATLSAVEIFGARHVEIFDCDLSGSGGAVAPGTGQHHNLKLSHVEDATISGSRLTDSLCGDGLSLTFCQNVDVKNCELARNAMNGARLAQCTTASVEGSLVEGNAGFPLLQETWFQPNAKIQMSGDLTRLNADFSDPPLRS